MIDLMVKVILIILVGITLGCTYLIVTKEYPDFRSSFLDGWKLEISQHEYC